MISNSTVTLRLIANLLVIAIGYVVKKLGLVSREEGRVLNRLVLYVTLPAASLLALSEATLSWTLLLLPLLLFAVAIAICSGGVLVARSLKLARADKGTFVVSLCGFMLSMAYPFFEPYFHNSLIEVDGTPNFVMFTTEPFSTRSLVLEVRDRGSRIYGK